MDLVATMLSNAYEHARHAMACIGINDRAAALVAIRETMTEIEAAGARVQRIRGTAAPDQTIRPEDD